MIYILGLSFIRYHENPTTHPLYKLQINPPQPKKISCFFAVLKSSFWWRRESRRDIWSELLLDTTAFWAK